MMNSHSDSGITLILGSIYEIFVTATPHHASCSISQVRCWQKEEVSVQVRLFYYDLINYNFNYTSVAVPLRTY